MPQPDVWNPYGSNVAPKTVAASVVNMDHKQKIALLATGAAGVIAYLVLKFKKPAVLKEGDAVPSVPLMENTPDGLVDLSKELAKGKHVVFGVPGAFTPGCSKTHLPGYVQDAGKWKSKGVASISCISVNDVFCMAEWGKAHQADGKVRMLADPQGEWVKAAGLSVDASKVLGNVRSKRFALLVEDGKVRHIEVEPDGFGLSCSLSANLFAKL